MTQRQVKRHWLDKAEPKYWATKGYWRVRAMRNGKHSQWLMEGGKGDNSSTGAAIALAEWNGLRARIIRDEQAFGGDDDDGIFMRFKDDAEEHAFYSAVQLQGDWRRNETKTLGEVFSFEDYCDFREWQRSKKLRRAVAAGETVKPVAAITSKPFRDLTAIFKAHLDYRLEHTVNGLRSSGDISEARHRQYGFALAHLNKVIGSEVVEPLGDYQISEAKLSELLAKYRQVCTGEMKAKKYGVHSFNERMKTARSLTTYLVENRLCTATPPNVYKLTEKYKTDPTANPIPLPILKILWNEADDRLRAFMLFALNCGFRQTEIGSLSRQHVKTISGQVCIEKRKGKTGVPLSIPLWKSTQQAMEVFGSKSGNLFNFEGVRAIDVIGKRFEKVRRRAAKVNTDCSNYSFEDFRDTGASFIESVNPMLTPLYLAQADTRNAKWYVGQMEGVPMQLAEALKKFESYLALPKYNPKLSAAATL